VERDVPVKPIYRVRVWRDGGWWLGRVIAAGDGADPAPINSLTQARALASVDSVVRDLIATVLDTNEDAFDIEIEYDPSTDGGGIIGQEGCMQVSTKLNENRGTGR
jgi:hypothetical protein